MRTQSIFQILLGLSCFGLLVTANVLWPFAHTSYAGGFFAASLYIICGWVSYRVSTDASRTPAEIAVAQCLTFVSIAADIYLLAQGTNNITAFLTEFLKMKVDWYKGSNLLLRGKDVVVCAIDIPIAALCFIHLLTAAVCSRKLQYMIYARDEETMIGAYIKNPSPALTVNPLYVPRALSYVADRHQEAALDAMMSSPYMARPHPLYPSAPIRHHGEGGLPRLPIGQTTTPKDQHH